MKTGLEKIVLPTGEIERLRAQLHAERHPLDVISVKGWIRVRVDGGDSSTPAELREYDTVLTGHGEGARTMLARRRRMFPMTKGSLR